MTDKRDLLKSNTLLASLDDHILDEFAKLAAERTVQKGEILTAELTEGDEIFLILEGEITIGVELAGADSSVAQLTAGAGELVGLIHFIEETVSHATEIAETDLKLLVWKASAWREICDQHPRSGYLLARGVAKMLVSRMVHFNMDILDSMAWGIE